jgi:hypothetical protein
MNNTYKMDFNDNIKELIRLVDLINDIITKEGASGDHILDHQKSILKLFEHKKDLRFKFDGYHIYYKFDQSSITINTFNMRVEGGCEGYENGYFYEVSYNHYGDRSVDYNKFEIDNQRKLLVEFQQTILDNMHGESLDEPKDNIDLTTLNTLLDKIDVWRVATQMRTSQDTDYHINDSHTKAVEKAVKEYNDSHWEHLVELNKTRGCYYMDQWLERMVNMVNYLNDPDAIQLMEDYDNGLWDRLDNETTPLIETFIYHNKEKNNYYIFCYLNSGDSIYIAPRTMNIATLELNQKAFDKLCQDDVELTRYAKDFAIAIESGNYYNFKYNI